jgi:hypothetical protein
MTERRCARKGRRLTRAAAAAGKRPAAPARRDRLDKPVLDLFEKRAGIGVPVRLRRDGGRSE